jgi:methyl-accepting chemotaxis protein
LFKDLEGLNLFKKLKISTKFLAIGIFLVSLLSIGLMGFFSHIVHQNTIEAFVSKARSITLAAESVRLEMDEKWLQGILTVEQARSFYEKQQMDKLLNMVPVVTAWRAAMKQAKAGEYKFRVPKFNPRNPKNEPDYGLDYQIEGPALKKIKENGLKEYFVIDKKQNAIRYFLPIKLSETCLMCHGDPATSNEIWGIPNGKDPTGGTMENWEAGQIHGAFEIIQSLAPADKKMKQNTLRAVLITVLGLFFVFIGYYFLVKFTVANPIMDVSNRLKGIAEGEADLTQRLLSSNEDEIGVLIANFNAFIENMHKMIQHVSIDTKTINSASEQLSEISQKMSGTSTETSSRTHSVSTSTDTMSSNLGAIAAAMDEATSNITAMASATEELNTTLAEIAKDSEAARTISTDGVEQSKLASQQISELESIAGNIGKVTATITDISDQTNLLALNATIEAARAGEYGKGFAIVAGEIKELSLQTAQATNEIRQQIESVQHAIQKTLKNISGMEKIISDINGITLEVADAVGEQQAATNEITSNISQVSLVIGEIGQKVSESSEMAMQVNTELAEVNNASKDVSLGSQNISLNVNELSSMAANLKQMVEKFKV